MRALVSGEVVQVDRRDPRVDPKTGEVVVWWDAYLKPTDVRKGAERISGRECESTPCPSVGDRVLVDVEVSARAGNYGVYLSVIARSLAVEVDSVTGESRAA